MTRSVVLSMEVSRPSGDRKGHEYAKQISCCPLQQHTKPLFRPGPEST